MRHGPRTLKAIASALGVALLLALLVPTLTGRPVVSYASSGSMEPTIGTFDVFLVEPWPGALHVGDIVVFHSVSRDGPAVHRLVGGGPEGWYTQGDANPQMDQLGNEPPVMPEQILGRVVTRSDGSPILAPKLGLTLVSAKTEVAKLEQAVGGRQVLLAGIFALLALVLALPMLVGGKRFPTPPSAGSPRLQRLMRRLAPRGVLGKHLAGALVVAMLAAGVLAAHEARTNVHVTLIVVEDPAAGDAFRAAAPGHALDRDIRVGSLGLLPTLAILEAGSDRVAAPSEPVALGVWSTATLVVSQTAGDDVGVQDDTILVTRYPRMLPDGWTLALHDATPGGPYLAIAAALAVAVWTSIRAMGLTNIPIGRWLGLREAWL